MAVWQGRQNARMTRPWNTAIYSHVMWQCDMGVFAVRVTQPYYMAVGITHDPCIQQCKAKLCRWCCKSFEKAVVSCRNGGWRYVSVIQQLHTMRKCSCWVHVLLQKRQSASFSNILVREWILHLTTSQRGPHRDGLKAVMSRQRQRSRQRGRGEARQQCP